MIYRVKIEKKGDKGYFELISVGDGTDIEEAYDEALDRMEENKNKEQEREIK